MNGPEAEAMEAIPATFGITPSSQGERWKPWAHRFRPRFRDRRFWAVQGLVVVVAGFHFLVERLRPWETWQISDQNLTFIPISLLYIPVMCAALNFGSVGSTATALLCIVLTVPLPLLFHQGLTAATELFQLGIVAGIASFVGQRVDREQVAREQAEAASAASRASEMKYRGLFESSPVPILVTDPVGTIFETNPAAGGLFGKDPAHLRNVAIADLVGPVASRKLLGLSQESGPQKDHLSLNGANGSQVYLEPIVTRIGDGHGSPVIEIQLRDVTEERQRQAGLRAFAANILRAQEEERRRIAQELHDETVQQLVLLCRQLDLIESAGESPSPILLGELRAARRTAETVVEGLRDFAHALRPPTLDDLGLVTSIRRLLVDFAERARIDGDVTIVGEERRLPSDVELCLFRIAQEAIRNVERHARASHVSVRIVFGVCRVGLEVVDNGIGFNPPTVSDLALGGHLGLLGMRERAESRNGTLEVTSNRQEGTRVTVLIPEGGVGCQEIDPED